jgi:flagellar motility protein MotE (MotC chaperone)
MSKILQLVASPALVAVVGVLAGTAVGLGWFWRMGEMLVTQAIAARAMAAKEKKTQGWDFWTIEIDNLASELKEEKGRLKKQSEALDQRAARLTAEQQELEKLRASIEAMRKEIGEKVIEMNVDEAKNLRALAQTYTNLTPRAAVAIVREMDDTTVVKILSLMKPDVVAPIFEEMSKTPDKDGLLARRAAALSEKLRLMKANRTATTS